MAYETQNFNLETSDIEIVQDFATQSGAGNLSAALRMIIREWSAARQENAKRIRTAVRAKVANMEPAR